jgi:hypothetical protein
MKLNVTFLCSLVIDSSQVPRGRELAEYLIAKFLEHGIEIRLVDNYDDFAWWLDVEGQPSHPWLLVGFVGDRDGWLVQIRTGVGWMGRLIGRSDLPVRERVAQKLHAILSADLTFSGVRWHEGDFAEVGWSNAPT